MKREKDDKRIRPGYESPTPEATVRRWKEVKDAGELVTGSCHLRKGAVPAGNSLIQDFFLSIPSTSSPSSVFLIWEIYIYNGLRQILLSIQARDKMPNKVYTNQGLNKLIIDIIKSFGKRPV